MLKKGIKLLDNKSVEIFRIHGNVLISVTELHDYIYKLSNREKIFFIKNRKYIGSIPKEIYNELIELYKTRLEEFLGCELIFKYLPATLPRTVDCLIIKKRNEDSSIVTYKI